VSSETARSVGNLSADPVCRRGSRTTHVLTPATAGPRSARGGRRSGPLLGGPMARGRRGHVYKRCGCRDAATGKRKGPGCDLLRRPLHGSWYLSLEVPAGAAGERRRIRLGGHRSRRQAEAALRMLQTPCSAGGTAAWTTGRWLRHWLTGRVSLRPSTRRMYESHLRLYLLPYLDRTPLAALTTGEVRAMFLDLPSAPCSRHAAVGDHAAQHQVHAAGGAERGDPGRAADRQPGPVGRAAGAPPTTRGGLDSRPGRRLASRRCAPEGRGLDRRRHRPLPHRHRRGPAAPASVPGCDAGAAPRRSSRSVLVGRRSG